MKSFLKIASTSLGIVGGIIGAGFITGREIGVFFAFDFSLSAIYSATLFFFIVLLIYSRISNGTVAGKLILKIAAIADILVLSCMYAALDMLAQSTLRLSENVKIFSVLSSIIVFFIARQGICRIRNFALFILPFEIAIILSVCLYGCKIDAITVSPTSIKGICYPIIYMAMNSFLVSPLVVAMFSEMSKSERLTSAFSATLIIGACILCVAYSVTDFPSSSAPLLIFARNKSNVLFVLLNGCALLAVFNSILAATSSVYSVLGNNDMLKFFATLVSLAFSRSGFSFITEKVYPFIGLSGIVVLIVLLTLRVFFPKALQERTLYLPKRRG